MSETKRLTDPETAALARGATLLVRAVEPQPKHRLIDGLAHVTIGMDPADDGAVWYDGDCKGPGREVRAPWRVGDRLPTGHVVVSVEPKLMRTLTDDEVVEAGFEWDFGMPAFGDFEAWWDAAHPALPASSNPHVWCVRVSKESSDA